MRAGASIAVIREHGYRFPSIEAAIDAIEPEEDVVVPECERIWVDQLLDDLAYAIHRCRNSRRRDRLSEVWESIESEVQARRGIAKGARRFAVGVR